jgi:hypothetical protein
MRCTVSSALALALSLSACGAPDMLKPCSSGECASRPDAGPPIDAGAPQLTEAGAPKLAEADAACAQQKVRAEHGSRRPVDIIFVIDNSGSMADEIAAVRNNIQTDFASIIEDSGVDYRVIMVSRFGLDATGVCIEPPLSSHPCTKDLESNDGPRYFQYSQDIGSNDGLCQLLDTFDRPLGKHAPHGFQEWLRKDASKDIVIITDDDARCTYRDDHIQLLVGADNAEPFDDALAFHAALRAKAPEQFAGAYQFFSIVGLKGKDPDTDPLFPSDPLDPNVCSTAPGPGLSYQALSVATDALRYPVCEGRSFDAIFHAIADSVIKTSYADCTFQLPAVKAPEILLLSTVNLELQHDQSAPAEHYDQVKTPDDCKDDHSFYISDRIELCPRACQEVQRDKDPQVQILYGCATTPE